MADQYYIRQPDSEDARGPFEIDKLISLVEADQVSRETLYYNEDKEEWIAIEDDPEILALVFPEKQKLGLRAKTKEDMKLLNADEDEIPEVSVDEMLAAAEGDTDETRHVKEKVRQREKAAELSIPAIGFIMLISAFNNIFPYIDVITQIIDDEDYMLLIQKPMLIVGLLDAFFAIVLFLKVSEIFPMLRFRAMLGLGYFGFLHWAQWFNGDQNAFYLMITAMAGSLAIFICTLTLNLYLMILFAFCGLAGMGGYAYFMFFAG